MECGRKGRDHVIWFGKPQTRGGKGHCGRRRARGGDWSQGSVRGGSARSARAVGEKDVSVSLNPSRGELFFVFEARKIFFQPERIMRKVIL